MKKIRWTKCETEQIKIYIFKTIFVVCGGGGGGDKI